MMKFQRFLSVSHSIIKLSKLIKHPNCVPSRIITFRRVICNSGGLIAGCCFSRQSDEETLLPYFKGNTKRQNSHGTKHLYPSTTEQCASYSKNMKRSSVALDDASSQGDDIDVDENKALETSNKRIKVTDEEDGITGEKASATGDAHINENEGILLPESEKSKQRPNYFVAVQITDEKIHRTLNELQQHMLEKDERLKNSLIQLATLHITLMVFHIGDQDTLSRAIRTLENIHREHDEELSRNPITLEFIGLSHFQNRVLYAKLLADDASKRLISLAESVKKHFTSSSIFSTDSRDFTPHLTVAKIKPVSRKSKNQNQIPRKINPSVYKEFNEKYFGSQKIKSIQLLKMTGPKDEAGYYMGDEIFFSAFKPEVRRNSFNEKLQTEEKKKEIKDVINALMKEKLK